ncbi:post-COAP-1 domain-containing protein [Sinomonas mesophila]|uniref:post-COAP-1 domain-containing protein n=1 Tax=Sinomonas mesophila TaxID=1531955 RepID=UPI0009876909|nr:post-COAP-1 domain-containing protein [Sinomonas mesophila]
MPSPTPTTTPCRTHASPLAPTKTWTPPVTTPLCQVQITKGGRITALNGDRATFGGNAQSDGAGKVKGQQEYQDHGPAQRQKVKSTQILALTCNPQRTQATIFGRAMIDGQGSHLFRVDVQDLAEPGVGQDTYRILLDTGYDSGTQKLEGGNIQIRWTDRSDPSNPASQHAVMDRPSRRVAMRGWGVRPRSGARPP